MTSHQASSSSVQLNQFLSPTDPPHHISRRLSGFSIDPEQSDHGAARAGPATTHAQDTNPAVAEEINEIKRYEDFTTIDWVQDAVQEQARRRARRKEGSGFWDQEGTLGWRRKLSESYDAGQAWLVVTLVGAAIGLNAAFLNIVTEWLSDVKLGYCTTAFYLNEQFCCWGAEDGMFLKRLCGGLILTSL
jgi:chloride channel 3/4/5